MRNRQPVKICGISDTATALVAARAGADYIGLVFYPGSHRYVTPERAREIADAIRAHAQQGHENAVAPVGVELVSARDNVALADRVETSSALTGGDGQAVPRAVGLFVNVPVDEVLRVRELVGLDVIQLSGNEPASDMRRLRAEGVPFLATVRVGDDDAAARARFEEIAAEEPFAIHLDTHVPGMWGGSGVVGDWELARELAEQYPVFLAGGLDPGNVRAAVEQVRPFAVDVSSGVETDKQKDHDKIRAFIAAARGRGGEHA